MTLSKCHYLMLSHFNPASLGSETLKVHNTHPRCLQTPMHCLYCAARRMAQTTFPRNFLDIHQSRRSSAIHPNDVQNAFNRQSISFPSGRKLYYASCRNEEFSFSSRHNSFFALDERMRKREIRCVYQGEISVTGLI